MILKGYDNETIADIVNVSISSVTNWRKILNAHNDDLCSLVRKTGSGRPPSLNDPQKQQLKQILLEGAVATGYPAERWTSKIVAHYYYGCKRVMIIFDRLSSPIAAKEYFERTRSDWFLVEYLPSYAPELNPVEQCWHYMKNVAMVNFVPMCRKQLEAKAEEAVQAINADPKLLPAFFQHAKLKL